MRIVQFHRADETQIAEGRINHHRFDPLGRLIASSDPRLFALAQADPEVPANLTRTLSLSGLELLSESVDAGWHIRLPGEAGQPLEQWDGRGTYGVVEYDSLLRPLTIHERGQDQITRVVERFTYGGPGVDEAAHNGCGQLIRHDHPAGTDRFEEYSIRAAVLRDSRAFLQSMEMPDWPLSEAARDPLLESVPPLVTRYAYNPLGETVAQTDAYGNVQRFEMTCTGALRSSHLKLTGQPEQLLVNELGYNASGQLERQTGGNGVTSTHVYDPANGLLTRLTAARMNGTALQDLNYQYDPAVKRLQEHSNHPRGMTKIFESSLGARMQKKVFRGARMPKASMEFLIKGREVTTSGFTAFSPAQEEAKKFMGPTYHDEAVHNATAPVLFTLQGGAKAITPVVEEEALVAPDRNFVVDSVTHKARYLEVELKSRHSGGRGLWI